MKESKSESISKVFDNILSKNCDLKFLLGETKLIPELSRFSVKPNKRKILRLLFKLTSLSKDYLQMQDYWKLIDKFSALSPKYKREIKLPNLLKNILLGRKKVSKRYPIKDYQNFENLFQILEKLANIERFTLRDYLLPFYSEMTVNKIKLEKFQKMVDYFIEYKSKKGEYKKCIKDFGQFFSQICKASIYFNDGNHDKARKIYDSVFLHYNADKMNEDRLMVLANLYKEQNDIPKAINVCKKLFKKYKKEANESGISSIAMKLANLYRSLAQYRKAIEYYQIAYGIYEENKNYEFLTLVCAQLGDLMAREANNEADHYYTKAASFSKLIDDEQISLKWNVKLLSKGKKFDTIPSVRKKITILKRDNSKKFLELAKEYEKLGELYLQNGELKKSSRMIHYSIYYNELLKRWRICAMLAYRLAKLFDKNGMLDKAINYAQCSLKFDRKAENIQGCSISHLKLAHLYKSIGNHERSIKHYKEAVKLDLSSHKIRNAARNSYNLGNIFLEHKLYEEALNCFYNCTYYKIRDENFNLIFKSIDRISAAFSEQNKFHKVKKIHKFQNSIEYFEKQGDLTQERIFMLIGNLYYSLREFNLALKFYNQVKIDCKRSRNDYLLAQIYTHLGRTYNRLKLPEFSLFCYRKASLYFKKTKKTTQNGWSNLRIGDNFKILGNLRRALNQYHIAEKIFSEKCDYEKLAIVYSRIAEIYLKLKKYNETVKSYKESAKFYKQNENHLKCLICYRNIADIWHNLDKYELSAQFTREILEKLKKIDKPTLPYLRFIKKEIKSASKRRKKQKSFRYTLNNKTKKYIEEIQDIDNEINFFTEKAENYKSKRNQWNVVVQKLKQKKNQLEETLKNSNSQNYSQFQHKLNKVYKLLNTNSKRSQISHQKLIETYNKVTNLRDKKKKTELALIANKKQADFHHELFIEYNSLRNKFQSLRNKIRYSKRVRFNPHGYTLKAAKQKILKKLKVAKKLGFKGIVIIHGYRHGQILRDYFRSENFIQDCEEHGYKIEMLEPDKRGKTIFDLKK